MFDGAKFFKSAVLGRVEFGMFAWFSEVEFCGLASFDVSKFAGVAVFDSALFGGGVGFSDAHFSEVVRLEGSQFGGGAVFMTKADEFGEDPVIPGIKFDGARVRLDVILEHERVWPDGVVVDEPASDEMASLQGHDGRWGYLVAVEIEDAGSDSRTT